MNNRPVKIVFLDERNQLSDIRKKKIESKEYSSGARFFGGK